jgi:hypothetical protein
LHQIGGSGNNMPVPTLNTYTRKEIVEYALSQYSKGRELQGKVWELEKKLKKLEKKRKKV